ncbi:MAG: hypothetical protein ACC661_10245 [Verrucomicrobiales bacterium]
MAESAAPKEWNDIWASLCYQYTTYSATYAAFPHIVGMASQLAIGERMDHIKFLGIVSAYERKTRIDAKIEAAYRSSIPKAFKMAFDEIKSPELDFPAAVSLIQAVAGLNGCSLGRVIEGFAHGEFSALCPGCSLELFIWPSNEGYRVHIEDPIVNRKAEYTLVTPAKPTPVLKRCTRPKIRDDNPLAWIPALARDARQPKIGDLANALLGTGICPKCERKFDVQKEVTKHS